VVNNLIRFSGFDKTRIYRGATLLLRRKCLVKGIVRVVMDTADALMLLMKDVEYVSEPRLSQVVISFCSASLTDLSSGDELHVL
jgi:hypothetical protein